MRNLMRILSCLLTGILCVLFLAGCSGSSADSEDSADGDGDTAAVAEEDANIEDETVTTSADYTTLTISTYDADTSGNQTLSSTVSYDRDGNLLEDYYIYDTDTAGDAYVATVLESGSTYSYDENGLISAYSHYQVNYLNGEESVEEYTVYFNYEYDDEGNITLISYEWENDSDDGELAAVYALLTYNTEGNVSSVYFGGTSGYSDEEIDENIQSDDLTEGATLDFSYYFDEINGMTFLVDSYKSYRSIEYDENGMISGIGYSGNSSVWLIDYVSSVLTYDVFKYMDSIQNSDLASHNGYILMTYSNAFYGIEYDSLGNIISRKFYDCEEYYEEEDLVWSYTYEYEYDEYERVSAAYMSLYDEDGDQGSTCVSYYEYE